MTLDDAIHQLERLSGDPRTGLPEELFLFGSSEEIVGRFRFG